MKIARNIRTKIPYLVTILNDNIAFYPNGNPVIVPTSQEVLYTKDFQSFCTMPKDEFFETFEIIENAITTVKDLAKAVEKEKIKLKKTKLDNYDSWYRLESEKHTSTFKLKSLRAVETGYEFHIPEYEGAGNHGFFITLRIAGFAAPLTHWFKEEDERDQVYADLINTWKEFKEDQPDEND